MRSEWNFDTIKTVSALGSIRGTLHELSMPSGMVPEETEEDDFSDDGFPQDTLDSSAATRGSDPIVPNGIDASKDGMHSTIIIKPAQNHREIGTDERLSGTSMYLSNSCSLFAC